MIHCHRLEHEDEVMFVNILRETILRADLAIGLKGLLCTYVLNHFFFIFVF